MTLNFNSLHIGDCDKVWKVVERKKNTELVCCVRGTTKDSTVTALEDLKKEIGVNIMVK